MNLRPGVRLRSMACTTEVVVVRVADPSIELRCGGAPMVDGAVPDAPSAILDVALSEGTRLGKRYVLGSDLEVLVTKPGAGSLSVGGTLLSEKSAAQLPSSD